MSWRKDLLGFCLPLLPSCRHVVLNPSVRTRAYVGSSFATRVALWYHSVGWSLLTFPSGCFLCDCNTFDITRAWLLLALARIDLFKRNFALGLAAVGFSPCNGS